MPGRRLAVPPGRSGRLWLQHRRLAAGRGADLLDRKLRMLRGELAALRAAQARAAAEWDQHRADAEAWLLRTALLGGERALRLSTPSEPAEVTVAYATVMGVRYPARPTCRIPAPETWESPALAGARKAHQEALRAAASHAVATEAVRLVEAEALATQVRLRAIRDRWIPLLEQAIAEVTLAIEEQEIADSARLRLWADGGLRPGQRTSRPGDGDLTGNPTADHAQ